MNQNNTLASKIFARLEKLDDGNIFFSPYSIYTAILMVLEGASDEVKTEAMEATGLVLEDKIRIPQVQQVILEIANSFWHDKEIEIFESYKNKLREEYNAEVLGRDFKSKVTINEINDWVSKNTHGKIKSIIDSFTTLEKAILINAVYFKAKWINPFPTKDTKPHTFCGLKGEQSVPMMNIEKEFAFILYDGPQEASLIDLPYRGGGMSMVVVVPNYRGETEINDEQISKWFNAIDCVCSRKVRLTIPKFKMEQTIDISSIIKDIGMGKMFKDSCLDKMATDLCVSRILHKSYVDMDEEGTEAAAVTACTLRCKSAYIATPIFIVDSPFIFFIRHIKTNTVMFMGKIVSL